MILKHNKVFVHASVAKKIVKSQLIDRLINNKLVKQIKHKLASNKLVKQIWYALATNKLINKLLLLFSQYLTEQDSVILIHDRIILSVDDKKDNEFVFATIKNDAIKKTLYFTVVAKGYNNFKTNHPKSRISGFWHSLFINNKIQLGRNTGYILKTDELAYLLFYDADNNDIKVSFQLLAQLDESTANYLVIDNELKTNYKFFTVISSVDKVKKLKLKKQIYFSTVAAFWVLFLTGLYFYWGNSLLKQQTLKNEIAKVESQIKLIGGIINVQKKKVVLENTASLNNISNLLFLKLKGIDINGEVDTKATALKIESTSNNKLLKAFIHKYKQFNLILQAESPSIIEFSYE